jgi:myo-inositol-1(or 4)-monophosphatase
LGHTLCAILNMLDVCELLDLSKSIATQAGLRLLDSIDQDYKGYSRSLENPKEIKALADTVLEKEILQALMPVGFPVLSEESGYLNDEYKPEYWFIVDPLDGTFNFVKGLGPCAISIALWQDQKPIFGVIYNILEKQLFWGGKELGAFCEGQDISVSETRKIADASICTGFPVRLDVADESTLQYFWRMVSPFSKVRMIGSAAVSLVNVARGNADVYSERNIMLWDVAAGLAIVEGAGGEYVLEKAGNDWSCRVLASNPHLFSDSTGLAP